MIKKNTLKKKQNTLKNKKKYTKKKIISNKIAIDINFSDKDCGFKALTSNKVFEFFKNNIKKGRNLFQTVPGKSFVLNKKTTIYLQAIPFNNYKFSLKWKDINCKIYNSWLRGSYCKDKPREKLFLKFKGDKTAKITEPESAHGFGSYFYNILNGNVNLNKHITFIKVLKKIMKDKKIIVHNMDVDWFHLKSEI